MPFQTRQDGLAIAIRLTPQARRDAIDGVMDAADGKRALKVSINAVPEDGKANKALLDFLAKTWKLPKSSLSLLSGHTSRHKLVLAAGDASALLAQLRQQSPDLFV